MEERMSDRTPHQGTSIIEEEYALTHEGERLERLLAFFTEKANQVGQRLEATRQLAQKAKAVSKQVEELMEEVKNVREENKKTVNQCKVVVDAQLTDEIKKFAFNEDRVEALKKESHAVNRQMAETV